MTAILLKVLLESLKAIVGKLAFAVVSERFLSRLVCFGLRKIAEANTNEFCQESAEAIINAIKQPDLPEIK